MEKNIKLKVTNEINHDIETGVYDRFSELKKRLLFISKKLFESIYVINSSKELSDNEIKTLIEQGYLDTKSSKEFNYVQQYSK